MPQHHSPRAARLALAVLAAGAAALLACGSEDYAARWAAAPIAIDGKLDEWSGAMTTLRSVPARVGVLNDGQALYVALATDDPALARRIARAGLTVWIDRRGTHQKELGVRFPLPAYASSGGPDAAPDPGRPGGARVDRVELLGPAPYTRHEVDAPGENGVQVAVGGGPGVITYELRVPLAAEPWGAGVRPGDTIALGVETNRMEGWTGGRPRGEGDGDEGGPGGPGDGRGPQGQDRGEGGERGEGRGPDGAGHGERATLEAWARVKLAAHG